MIIHYKEKLVNYVELKGCSASDAYEVVGLGNFNKMFVANLFLKNINFADKSYNNMSSSQTKLKFENCHFQKTLYNHAVFALRLFRINRQNE